MWDSHMHTPLCRHATGKPLDYALAASAKGLTGITMTDHCPMPAWFDAGYRMTAEQLPLYLDLVAEAASGVAGRLDVRLGMELDFHPGTERHVGRLAESLPLDYALGSIHYIGAWPFDNPDFAFEFDERDLTGVYADYYALVEAAAASCLFDAIGHLDLPKKFGHAMPAGALPHALRALDAIAANGLALDVNSAGYRKPAGEVYPSPGLLAEARSRGIPVVLGSDAHAPTDVGRDFERSVATLREAGYTSAVVFRGRKSEAYPLPGIA
ncbi:MAG TPA: histidinol-phosphatase HisJ family protein [Deinococcales bacterium]|nr:histidinol-phosphatase HisJ family protein [Deinococcales bacterium]